MTIGIPPITGNEIRSFRKKNKLSQTEFAELVGVSMRAVQLWESGDRKVSSLAEKTIREVFLNYKKAGNDGAYIDNNGNRFTRTNEGGLVLEVPLLTVEAHARYLDDFGEAGAFHFEEKVPFVIDKIDKGNFLAFRISGDSMNGGRIDDTPDRATVLGKEMPMDLWMDGFGDSRFGWIIITRRNILFKDIVAFDRETATITCHSRNDSPEYCDFNLCLNDINKIFKVVKRTF
ncbi:helix-turn-helix domain-containing protein [Emticicia sp. 17c]|uniref:helix-turn-helix domain-containing protein n=1 Tax=Emticicia sp. 17c TaxID=3127704 RepID=UPI00301CB7B1